MVYEVQLKLGTDEEGVMWPRRPQIGSSGLIGCLRNTPLRSNKTRTSSNAQDGQPNETFGSARFRCVAFSVGGDIFAAVDEKGRVFAFFPLRNRYSLVCHLGTPAIQCAFSPQQRTELLVTCEDLTIRCVDVQTKTLVSTLRGHRQAPNCVSFQRSGQLALTASTDAVIMWDSANWSRFRTLNAGPGVEAAQFVGNGELVAVCFRDDSILMWQLSTLALQYRFTLPEYEQSPQLKRFCVSETCQVIVASGVSPFIYVWEFESQTLIRIIELPASVHRIIQHNFVPTTSNILGVLGDDGQINFLNVTSKQPKVSLQITHKIKAMTAFDIESHGKYLVACTSDGCLVLYDLDMARESAYKIQDIRQRANAEEMAFLPHRSALAQPSSLIDSLFGPLHSRETENQTPQDQMEPAASSHPPPRPIQPKKSPQPILSNAEYALQRNRLQQLLRSYGRFPEKYRLLAWKFLLRLPENTAALEHLMDRGDHPATLRLHETYPIQNQRLFRRLKRILNALAHWCPVYGEIQTIPALVFPFVKVCSNNDIIAFEIVMSVLLHWGHDFVLQFPHPPRHQLARLDSELQERDPQLHTHFTSHRITPEDYGWSLVSTAFSEVLDRDDWLCLWDNLIAYWDSPALLWAAVLTFLAQIRGLLLQASTASGIQSHFHLQQQIQTKQWIAAIHSFSMRPLSSQKKSDEETYFPLPCGQYPTFKRYPTFVVDYQIQERNRIATDEAALEAKRTLLAQIETRTKELEEAHQKWMDEKSQILEAEHRRRAEAMEAEKLRIMEMNILHSQTRERRLKQISMMEQTAKEALRETTKVLHAEHERWMDELNLHTEKEKWRAQQQVDEEELTRLEIDAQRRVKQLTKDRERDERLQQMRLEFFAQLREQEVQDQMVFDSWKDEDRRAMQAEEEARMYVETKKQKREEAKLRREWRAKFNEQRLQKQRQMQLLAQERSSRPLKEAFVGDSDSDISDLSSQLSPHEPPMQETNHNPEVSDAALKSKRSSSRQTQLQVPQEPVVRVDPNCRDSQPVEHTAAASANRRRSSRPASAAPPQPAESIEETDVGNIPIVENILPLQNNTPSSSAIKLIIERTQSQRPEASGYGSAGDVNPSMGPQIISTQLETAPRTRIPSSECENTSLSMEQQQLQAARQKNTQTSTATVSDIRVDSDMDVPPLVPDPDLAITSLSPDSRHSSEATLVQHPLDPSPMGAYQRKSLSPASPAKSTSQNQTRSRQPSIQLTQRELLQRALDEISSSDEDDNIGEKKPKSHHFSRLEEDLRAEFSDLSGSDIDSLEQRPLSDLERDLEDLLCSDDDASDIISNAPSTTELQSLMQKPAPVIARTPAPSPLTTDKTLSETTKKLLQLRSKLSDLEAMASKSIPAEVEERLDASAARDDKEHTILMDRAKELLEKHATRLRKTSP